MKDDKLRESTVESRLIYSGPVFDLYSDRVMLPNGGEAERDHLVHRGAVAVVALDDEGNVIMERQYCYPHKRVMQEIPAGKLEPSDADPLEAAKRELREETGITADRWIYLGEFISSPAILTEVIRVYLARGLASGDTSPGEDEFLEVYRLPLGEAVKLIGENRISDGKTVFGIMKAWMYLGEEKNGQR